MRAALSPLWRHTVRDVIGHVTIQFSIDDFLYVLKSNL